MRFCQLDTIVELVPGQRIVAIRDLTGNEDYLRDHFPLFPVMPGVLMLEALFQASCWLIRSTRQYADSCLMLKEARNVKFADFLQPGQSLTIRSEIHKMDGDIVSVKALAQRGDITTVSGRLFIECSNFADKSPDLTSLDKYIRRTLKLESKRLTNQI